VRRYAELQPIFAGSFRIVGSFASVPSSEMLMTATVAMPAAFGVSARHQVAHRNFLRLLFVHITFLQVTFGLYQFCQRLFALIMHAEV
jgi:hypothetical protein